MNTSNSDWLGDGLALIFRPGPRAFEQAAQHAEGKFNGGLLTALASVILWELGRLLVGRGVFNLVALVILVPVTAFLLILLAFWLHFLYQKLFKREQNAHLQIFYLLALLTLFLGLPSAFLVHVTGIGSIIAALAAIYALILLVAGLAAITGLTAVESIVIVIIGIPLSLLSLAFLLMMLPSVTSAVTQLL
jgi:hypothetical protein